MPNNYEIVDNLYNSFFAYKLGKDMNKDNLDDKFKIGEQELSKSGTLLGGVSLLGSLASWNENRQRQNIVNNIRQDSYDNAYVNVPTDNRYNPGIVDMFNNSSFKDGGQIPDRYKEMGFTRVDTPKRTPNASKSHAVVIKEDGDYRLIRFGQQGVNGSPKREGESEADRKRRASFKARHASNIAKGKTSAAYWANKVKWEDGGLISEYGYREDSPYKNEPYLDIDSNVISMLGVSKPLIAYPDNDEPTIMYPNQEYYFPNSNTVREVPLYQNGGNIQKLGHIQFDSNLSQEIGETKRHNPILQVKANDGNDYKVIRNDDGSYRWYDGNDRDTLLYKMTDTYEGMKPGLFKSTIGILTGADGYRKYLNSYEDAERIGVGKTGIFNIAKDAFLATPLITSFEGSVFKGIDGLKYTNNVGKTILKESAEQTLGEINQQYKSGGIYINPENKGVFTKKADKNDMSVQQYANYVLSHKDDFSVKTRRQVQFAKNSKKFKHQDGGEQQSEYEDWQIGYEQQTPQQANSIEDYMRDNPDDYEIYEAYGKLFADEPEIIVDPEIQYWEMQQQEYNNQQEQQKYEQQSQTKQGYQSILNNPNRPNSIYPIVEHLRQLGYKPSSVDSGKHNVGSKHGRGLAVDLGINTTFGGDSKKMQNFLDNEYPKLKQMYPNLKLIDERNHPKGQKVWSGSHYHLEIN